MTLYSKNSKYNNKQINDYYKDFRIKPQNNPIMYIALDTNVIINLAIRDNPNKDKTFAFYRDIPSLERLFKLIQDSQETNSNIHFAIPSMVLKELEYGHEHNNFPECFTFLRKYNITTLKNINKDAPIRNFIHECLLGRSLDKNNKFVFDFPVFTNEERGDMQIMLETMSCSYKLLTFDTSDFIGTDKEIQKEIYNRDIYVKENIKYYDNIKIRPSYPLSIQDFFFELDNNRSIFSNNKEILLEK